MCAVSVVFRIITKFSVEFNSELCDQYLAIKSRLMRVCGMCGKIMHTKFCLRYIKGRNHFSYLVFSHPMLLFSQQGQSFAANAIHGFETSLCFMLSWHGSVLLY
jgi:hypothetical protein